jgi:hypothetical protein
LKKVIGGALAAIEANDCLQNVPMLLRAYGSPVNAFVLTPEGAAVTGWVSNLTAQTASISTVTLAAGPGMYNFFYYADQNATCTTGANSVAFTFNWTDGTAARSVTTGNLALGAAQSATGGFLSGLLPIYIGSGSLAYASTVVGTCLTGTSSYDVHVALTRLQ